MRDYADQRAWSDQFIPDIRRIVGRHLLNEAPERLDRLEATDLMMLNARDRRIAARVRRNWASQRYPNQFTLRSRIPSGGKTELAKIIEGKGDWMFYGFADESDSTVERWMLLDLNVFRSALIRRHSSPIRCGDMHMSDGTSFKWFDVGSFPTELVIAMT